MAMQVDKAFADFASRTAKATGSPVAFGLCMLSVILWAASGPLFHFSETWQLVAEACGASNWDELLAEHDAARQSIAALWTSIKEGSR